jgi:hypothetical protein
MYPQFKSQQFWLYREKNEPFVDIARVEVLFVSKTTNKNKKLNIINKDFLTVYKGTEG